ncbi:F-box only protein 21-like [Argiope bruennichi]|uniref:F-box only protein 21-like n=1 Tax=Argiope bruennichi TaxID=94029 RepID=UPI0024956BEE|nr:F-box only protein 21-like [Argiope bruennichi]
MNENSVCFENLPSEIIENIFNCDILSFVDLCRISCVSQSLNLIARSNKLWRRKFALTYPASVLLYDPVTTDWKYEFRRRHGCELSILEKLQEMAIDFYHTENVSSDQFLNFKFVCSDHPFGLQVIIEDLWQIVTNTDSYHNLTLKYYAKRALRFMRHTYLETLWHDFLESDKKSLLKGACLLSQWCQPSDVYCTNIVSEHINDIVKLVYEEVKKAHPHHPVLRQKPRLVVNDCGEVLENSLWEPYLCRMILETINEVMFNKLKFSGNSELFMSPENNYIDKVLMAKAGYPSTLSVIYATVAAQLGVNCLPVCFPGHFLLKWAERPYMTGGDSFTYIDVHDGGTFKTMDTLTDLTSGYDRLSESWCEAISPVRVFTTMCWSLVEIARQQDGDGKGLLNLCNALELLSILTPTDTDHKLLLVRVYMHLCVNMARVINLLQEITENDPNATGIVSYLYRSAITTLETQRIKSEARKLKCQPRDGLQGVEFAVGMIMKHKKYKYRCVIYGWDVTCAAGKDWITSMGVYELKYKDQQPFYLVLVDDGTNRYAAQENLECDYELKPIMHGEIGRYFESFHGTYYFPNEQKLQEYPDDTMVREQVLNVNPQFFCQEKDKA